ncbi:MAG: hypothetical protein WCJ49_05690 [Deltaproteobacteria bacterium]
MEDMTKKYTEKHSKDIKIDRMIANALQDVASNNKVSCAKATQISQELSVKMLAVGVAMDVLNMRIIDCQLGIFGEKGKTITKASFVGVELETTLRESLENEKLPCFAVWEIAKQNGLSRKEVAQACETLKIKIKPCQLGAF